MTDNEIIAEIERLKSINKSKLDTIHDLRTEIEELKEQNLILSQKRANMFEILEAVERGRIRGAKEFAEKLIDQYPNEFLVWGGDSKCRPFKLFVDNLVKEMVGEE